MNRLFVLSLGLLNAISFLAFADDRACQAGAMPDLRGPYLGQTPPGLMPKVFAPGIVSSNGGGMVIAVSFGRDGRELCFNQYGPRMARIMVARMEGDHWTRPEEAPFSKGFHAQEPHITPDGRRLYFGWEKPYPGTNPDQGGIWFVEKNDAGAWGEPRYHGPGMSVSIARNGNLYMTDTGGIAGGGIVVFPRAGDRFGQPRRLGGDVDPAGHSWIAPDESFILFDTQRPGGRGKSDIWVCFRKSDDSWSAAFNLGNTINTPDTEWIPSISPDGRYIFYTTKEEDIYWVSAEILAPLKAKALGASGASK